MFFHEKEQKKEKKELTAVWTVEPGEGFAVVTFHLWKGMNGSNGCLLVSGLHELTES